MSQETQTQTGGDESEIDWDINLPDWNTDNLIAELLPFGYRPYDPLEVVREVRDMFDEVPPTVSTRKARDVRKRMGLDMRTIPDYRTLFELAGTYPYPRETCGPKMFVNPNYVHHRELDPSIIDKGKRLECAERWANYGIISHRDIAPRFGIGCRAVGSFLRRNGIDWRSEKRRGKVRFCRTVETIRHWTGKPYSEVLEPFPVEYKTALKWFGEYTDEYNPPDDPTGKVKFAIRDRD